jgi:hypothetical protein
VTALALRQAQTIFTYALAPVERQFTFHTPATMIA